MTHLTTRMSAAAAFLVLSAALPAFAQDDQGSGIPPQGPMQIGTMQGPLPFMPMADHHSGASSHEGHGLPALLGQVTALSGSTITIATPHGALTVDASSATIVRVPDMTITVADIAVGDTVLVQGSRQSGTITATRIMDGISTHMQPRLHEASTSKDSGDGDQEEQERGEHRGWMQGLGNMIFGRAEGNQGDRGEMRGASTTPMGPKGQHGEHGAHLPMLAGKITGVASPTFSIELPAGKDHAAATVTVTTTASTTFFKAGGGAAAFADLAVGSFARVQASSISTTTATATALRVEIASSSPAMMRPQQGDDRGSEGMESDSRQILQQFQAQVREASSTDQLKGLISNFIQRFGGLFRF